MNARLTDMGRCGLRAGLLGALLLLGGCAELNSQLNSILGKNEPPRQHARIEERSERTRARAERAERNERPAPRPERPAAERDDVALREGIALYENGDFNGAIKRLGSSDLNGGSVRNRVTALKYTAFSYCVTSRPDPCRRAFERAMRLDAGFELTPGEQGHPMWGPAYLKARQAAGREGARAASR